MQVRAIDFYEERAVSRGDMREYHFSHYAPYRRLVQTLSLIYQIPFQKGIDVGCGDGIFLEALWNHRNIGGQSAELVGIDISQTRLKRALSRSSAKVCCADIQALPFHDSSFDLVICTEVLEHVADVEKSISELSRIARNEGTVLLSVPVTDWARTLKAKLLGKKLNYLDEEEHLREYSLFQIERFTPLRELWCQLQSAGLEVQATRGVYFYSTVLERMIERLSCAFPLLRKWVLDVLDGFLGGTPLVKFLGRYLIIKCRRVRRSQ